MNILIGFGIVVIWLWYRCTRPYQFRIAELDGVYRLERKNRIFFFWDHYITQYASGDISARSHSDHGMKSRKLSDVQAWLDDYTKYLTRNDRKKIIRVELVQEDVIPEPKRKEEYKIEEMSYLEEMAALKN